MSSTDTPSLAVANDVKDGNIEVELTQYDWLVLEECLAIAIAQQRGQRPIFISLGPTQQFPYRLLERKDMVEAANRVLTVANAIRQALGASVRKISYD